METLAISKVASGETFEALTCNLPALGVLSLEGQNDQLCIFRAVFLSILTPQFFKRIFPLCIPLKESNHHNLIASTHNSF